MILDTKDLLTLAELSPREFTSLLRHASRLKNDLKKGRHNNTLRGKSLVMIFQKPSTRTRASFEIGMQQMGGFAINLAPNDMQLSRGETIADTARTLSRYSDCVMARVYEHEMVEGLALHSDIPVINGLSDMFHPCQILADFMTIKEKRGGFDDLKITWIGDGNNVCNSMLYGSMLAGASITVSSPKKYEPDKYVVEEVKKHIDVKMVSDPLAAARGADVIVTDTFTSIHNKESSRSRVFLPKYRVNQKIMDAALPDAIFMHCLPAKRGQEVTSEVIDGPQSVVWDGAENRLHVQKALLSALVK